MITALTNEGLDLTTGAVPDGPVGSRFDHGFEGVEGQDITGVLNGLRNGDDAGRGNTAGHFLCISLFPIPEP